MFAIVELNDRARICSASGDVQWWLDKEKALEEAVKISAQNNGVFQVMPVSECMNWRRSCRVHGNPYKIRGIYCPTKH